MGVGGVRQMVFQVIGEGSGNIDFVFGRPWEIQPKIVSGEDISSYVQKIVPIIVTSD
jgi:hypothetical protein